jgi:hypothetical protein
MDQKIKDLLTDSQLSQMQSIMSRVASGSETSLYCSWVMVNASIISNEFRSYRDEPFGVGRCQGFFWINHCAIGCTQIASHAGNHCYFEWDDDKVWLYYVWDDSLITWQRDPPVLQRDPPVPISPLTAYGWGTGNTVTVNGVTYVYNGNSYVQI